MSPDHRLNMELDLQSFIWAPCVQLYSLAGPANPPPPFRRIWAHMRGRYWSAEIDGVSLWPPAPDDSSWTTRPLYFPSLVFPVPWASSFRYYPPPVRMRSGTYRSGTHRPIDGKKQGTHRPRTNVWGHFVMASITWGFLCKLDKFDVIIVCALGDQLPLTVTAS